MEILSISIYFCLLKLEIGFYPKMKTKSHSNLQVPMEITPILSDYSTFPKGQEIINLILGSRPSIRTKSTAI